MTQRVVSPAGTATAPASCYEDMPFSQVLYRYLWPFWLFRDASRGDRLVRAAAYRHNRGMRVYLPGYLMKWTCGNALALGLMLACESFSTHPGRTPDLFTLMAAGAGVVFTCGVTIFVATAYVYLYLSRHAE